MVSKRQREYLREMGYKVNRDDDNGEGATNTRDLTLNIPAFWAFTQKIRVRFTGVVAKTIASKMRISSELSDDCGLSSEKLAKQHSVLRIQLGRCGHLRE